MCEPRHRLPLPAQLEKLMRLLDERGAHYRRNHAHGRITDAERFEKSAELTDIRLSFEFLVANHDWIKREAWRRRIQAEQARELEDLAKLPEVGAVLDAFPGATIGRITEKETEHANE